MNRIFSHCTALITILAQVFFVMSTSAQSLSQYLPEDAEFYVEIDTSQPHPFKGMIMDLIEDSLASPAQIAEELILSNIENQKFGFAQTQHQQSIEDIYYLAIAIDEDDFQQIIESADPSSYEIKIVGTKTLYFVDIDVYIGWKNEVALISNREGVISDFLLSDNDNSLNQHSNFQNFSEITLDESFFNLYLNYKQFEQFFPDTISEQGLDHLDYQGISVKQQGNTFEGLSIVKLAEDSPIDLSNSLAKPHIYQEINAENIIYFEEFYNFNAHLENLFEVLSPEGELDEVYAEFKLNFEEEFGISFDVILSLLHNQTAIIVHHDANQGSNTFLPGITLISEIEDKVYAENIGISMLDAIKNAVTEEYTTEYEYLFEPAFTLQEYLNDRAYYDDSDQDYQTLIIDPTANDDNAGDKYRVYISTGVFKDYFFITTHSNPDQIFSDQGLIEDEYFKDDFTAGNRELIDLTYLNFNNLYKYIQAIFTEIGLEQVEMVDTFFNSIDSIYSETTLNDDNEIISKISVRIYPDIIAEFLEEMVTYFEALGSSFEIEPIAAPILLELRFSDVQTSDWFYPYVREVYSRNIMTGYQDGTFRPQNPITRAEFVKTILSASDISMTYPLDQYNANFSDIEGQEWYSPYVNSAASHAIVEGFSDNTFRPNASITRAEAMQVLYNLNLLYIEPSMEPPFTDISANDWHYDAVQQMWYYDIVSGKNATTFAPNDLLTRAEAAKIISIYTSNL